MMTPHSLSALRILCLTAALASAIFMTGCKKDGESKLSTAKTTAANTTSQTTQAFDTTTISETTDTAGTIPEGVPPVGWCDASTLHVRSGPGTDYSVIGGLVKGEKVIIVDREGDWYKIKFKDGFAFVSAQYIQATEVMPDETTMAPAPTTTTTAAAQ